MSDPQLYTKLLPHLFRQEYAKMTAVLCRHFGLKHIEIAEDIESDTFLKASEHWTIKGVPENPIAWLYTVAKNKAKDYLKRDTISQKQIPGSIDQPESDTNFDLDFSNQIISDSELNMMFAICNPSNSSESQICLALQILCGFSVDEIANAFLTSRETIKKRLLRGRANLRNNNFQIASLSEIDVQLRFETVLKTLYLLFNEGYYSVNNNQLIRKDLCIEALRLMLILSENPLTDKPDTNALLALMCFQCSRLEARMSNSGEIILFEDQNKMLWDRSLIDRGNYYLIRACEGKKVTTYHIEAAIAYWHTTEEENKWEHILHLYNQLILMHYSPITALNRTFAFSKVHGKSVAITEAEKLNLIGNNQYHKLLGYLYKERAPEKAIFHFEKAHALTKSKTEKRALSNEIKSLKNYKTLTNSNPSESVLI